MISPLFAQVTFDFRDDFNEGNDEGPDATADLDQNGVGASVSLADTSGILTLTTIDVLAPEYSVTEDENGEDVVTATGVILSAAAGDGVETNIAGNQDAIGINNLSVGNSDFDIIGGGTEANEFNPDEAWVFSFDQETTIDAIEFESVVDADTFEILVDGTLVAELTGDGDILTAANNTVLAPMGTLRIAADSEITFRAVGSLLTTSIRVESMVVSFFPVGSGSDLEWTGGITGIWDTTALNFTDIASSVVTNFASGDNVTIPSAAAIDIGEAVIDAGNVRSTNPDATVVGFTGGNLFANRFDVLEAGTVQVANFSDGLFSAVSQGTLEILDGGTFGTNELTLSQGGTVLTQVGSILDATNGLIIGAGGGVINNETDFSVSVGNTILRNPLTKAGSGILTIAGGLGVQNAGPVALDVLEGSVVFTGSSQLNHGGVLANPDAAEEPDSLANIDSQIDGVIALNGDEPEEGDEPLNLVLHGSHLVGAGSIDIQSVGQIESRFNDGDARVDIPVVLNDELFVRSAAGNNLLFFGDVISGPSNVVKAGNGEVIFEAFNTYAGTTTVQEGALQLTTAYLLDEQPLTINMGSSQGMLILSHGEGDVVDSLVYDGVPQSIGTYGSSEVTGVALDNVDDARFAGTGWLVVTNGPAPPAPAIPLEIVDSGIEGDNFFIEVSVAAAGLVVTSSNTLDFDSATTVDGAVIDPENANRFLIPSAERNVIRDFFRVEESAE